LPELYQTPQKNNFYVESPRKPAERSQIEQAELEKPTPPAPPCLCQACPRVGSAQAWPAEEVAGAARTGAARRTGGGNSVMACGAAKGVRCPKVAARARWGPAGRRELRASGLHGRLASSARAASMAEGRAPRGLRARRRDIWSRAAPRR
jgi:hypothetical protein